MANTLGYITGVGLGLAVLCAGNYALDNPQRALAPVKDTESSLIRLLKKPEGYIGEGNFFEVLADAIHDIRQRNPGRAWDQLSRINAGLENTPYQDQKLRSSHYKNGRDIVDSIDEESDDQITISQHLPSGYKTKEKLVLAGAGFGLGLLGIAALGYVQRR